MFTLITGTTNGIGKSITNILLSKNLKVIEKSHTHRINAQWIKDRSYRLGVIGYYIDKNLKLVMDKDFFCKIISKGYKINKIHKFLGFFRWHYKNKSIYSKKFKKRIHYEAIIINNRYSNFKLPNNYFGHKIYYLMNRSVVLYRFFCRKTGLGVHYGNKKYKLKDRFI